jgi:hypothetical protein
MRVELVTVCLFLSNVNIWNGIYRLVLNRVRANGKGGECAAKIHTGIYHHLRASHRMV